MDHDPSAGNHGQDAHATWHGRPAREPGFGKLTSSSPETGQEPFFDAGRVNAGTLQTEGVQDFRKLYISVVFSCISMVRIRLG